MVYPTQMGKQEKDFENTHRRCGCPAVQQWSSSSSSSCPHTHTTRQRKRVDRAHDSGVPTVQAMHHGGTN